MLVKEKLQKEWQACWDKNQKDNYSKAAITVCKRVLELVSELDISQPINAKDLIIQANRELNGEITGAMAGLIANTVSRFSPRGKEFKKSWNCAYGVQEKESGVVNPAIVTVYTND